MQIRITYRVEAVVDAPDLNSAARMWAAADCVPQNEKNCGKDIEYGFVEEVSVEEMPSYRNIKHEFDNI